MSKHEAFTLKMVLLAICIMAIISCIEAVVREAPCRPKGGQFGLGLLVIIFSYIVWPTEEDQ